MTDITSDITEFFGSSELRWYQVASRNKIIKSINDGFRRICLVLPTGAGKTITVAATLGCQDMMDALSIKDRKLKVLFIAHNNRLLTQAERTFIDDNNVELITQSMASSISDETIDYGFDIIVIDEAHHEACISYQYRLGQLGEENPKYKDIPIIMLTATPDRADGMIIKAEVFINPISREQAVQEGYLAETYLYTFVDGSEKSKADVVIDILDSYAHQMNGTLVFVRTKAEAVKVNDHILKLGYESIALIDQSHDEVDNILDDFSNKKYQFIVSCNKLTEGCDMKNVQNILLGRVTGSFAQLNQIVGRAARPDCPCHVYEIVNPLAKDNLDTTVICAPIEHKLIYRQKGKWVEETFDYSI